MEAFILGLIGFLKELSYFGIIVALTFEFVPAELILPLVGYWVYTGEMNFILAVLAGSLGGTLGPLTLYALGRYGGRPMIVKYGKYFFIREKEIQASDQFFQKYGAGVAFFARFVPGIRTAISLPCGMAKMNIWVFTFYTFLAMLPITAFYIYLGLQLGPKWRYVEPLAKQYFPLIVVLLILLLIVYLLLNKWRKRHTIEFVRKL